MFVAAHVSTDTENDERKTNFLDSPRQGCEGSA